MTRLRSVALSAAPRPLWSWSTTQCTLVLLGLVVVFLWEPLTGQGSLLPADILSIAAPWAAEAGGAPPENITLSDTLDLHVHFASWAESLRAGDGSWWDRSLVGGIPILKAGFSPLLWLYLVVPAWYAPGLVAAVRTLVAAGLTYGFVRSLGAERIPALVAGVAFAFGGYMVGWASWPQSNVAAFAPGLLWATERLVRDPGPRRAVPVAAVTAAMVVSNFPVVTAYVFVAAALYAVVRLVSLAGNRRPWRPATALRPAGWGAVGVVLGVGLAALHIFAFSDYFDYGDSGPRSRLPADTSIGARFLLTLALPRAYGAHHTGTEFWAPGSNWVEAQSYAGVAVLVLALLALATTRKATGRARDRASAVRALWLVAGFGVWVSYVGGPLTEAIQSLPLLGENSVGRARVITNLALAALAGLGVQAWIDVHRRAEGTSLRHAAVWGGGGTAVALLAFSPWLWEWMTDVRDLDLVRETASASVVPVASGVVLLAAVLVMRTGDRWSLFPLVALTVVAVELLVFARPVATVVDRDRADLDTAAHQVVRDGLDPGERLAGDGRTFFPNTGQLTGIDDARGHLLISPQWREALRFLDADAFVPPGSVTNPYLAAEVDLGSPVLDRLGVGMWAADPASELRGARLAPVEPDGRELLGGAPVTVPVEVPDGGLRGVVVPTRGVIGEGRLVAEIPDPAGTEVPVRGWVSLAGLGDTPTVTVAIPAEDMIPGTTVDLRLNVEGGGELWVATTGDVPALSPVAGRDDGLRLVHADGVVIYERIGATAAWVAHAAVGARDEDVFPIVAADPTRSTAVVEPGLELGLPATAPPGAEATVAVDEIDDGTVTLRVDTSHPGVVVVSQYDYPGWTATVDGRSEPLFTVDGVATGVAVEAGSHVVELRYRPRHLGLAVALTAAAALGCALLWWGPSLPGRRR